MENLHQKLYDLKHQRAGFLKDAQDALGRDDMTAYKTAMDQAAALVDQIDAQQALINEMVRYQDGEPQGGIQPQQRDQLPKSVTDMLASREYARTFCTAMRLGLNPIVNRGDERISMLMNALQETGGSPEGANGGFLVPPAAPVTGFIWNDADYDGVRDESVFDDFGRRFEGTEVSIKPWPCCRFTNSCVDAALRIARDNDLDPTAVERITVFYAADDAKRCADPIELRRAPKTIPEAKLSLPFTVAQALAYRKLEIGDFSAEALADPLLRDLCAKTDAEYDAALESDFSKTMLPGRVRVELNDGTVYDERVDIVYGHPRNRMEWPDLAGKFRDCASYCKRALTADEIDAIASMVEHLEDVEDMSVLMEAVR